MVNNLPTSRAELEDKGIVIETSNSNFVEIRHCSSFWSDCYNGSAILQNVLMVELMHAVSGILAFVQHVWATPLMEVLHCSVVMW